MKAIKHLYEAPFHFTENIYYYAQDAQLQHNMMLNYKRWIEDKCEATERCERQKQFYLKLYQDLKQDEKVLTKEHGGSASKVLGKERGVSSQMALSNQKNTKDRLQRLENIISCIELNTTGNLEMVRRLSSQRGTPSRTAACDGREESLFVSADEDGPTQDTLDDDSASKTANEELPPSPLSNTST